MVSQPHHCDPLTRNKIKKSIYVSLNYCVILVVQLFLAVEAHEPHPQPIAEGQKCTDLSLKCTLGQTINNIFLFPISAPPGRPGSNVPTVGDN